MIEPFLKWPGGKRWLVSRHRALFPAKYNNYFEPFLGGGAVFFSLRPKKAVLSDSNAELANAYQCIKKHHLEIEKGLDAFQKKHNSDFYYQMREFRPAAAIDRAIRFLYLNRTCFNGIYRVNREGAFNVPIGTKDAVSFPQGYLEQVARALKHAQIRSRDFEKTIDKAQQGDFLFIDPPYTVMHNNNGFVKYNSRLFSWPDQARLAAAIKRASMRGVLIMMSNADHDSVRALYEGFGNHFALTRSSILAGDPSHRGSATELLLTNYSIPAAPAEGSVIKKQRKSR
jgi:DNA adenine methylase